MSIESACAELFDGPPPIKVQDWLGLARPGEPHLARRIPLAIAVAWLPLAAIAAWEGNGAQFLGDYAVHARFLAAVPLLIAADAVCAPRLGAIARHFADAGLVALPDKPRMDAAIASTLRLRDSTWTEILLVALTCAATIAMLSLVAADRLPAWHRSGDGHSAAGWWHALVSLPVLLLLVLGWTWRLLLWTRFLWLMARLGLRLVPSHPDKAAGLKFVGYSVRAWAIVALALGVVVAGSVANSVAGGEKLVDYRHLIGGYAAFAVVLFNLPLFAFTHSLLNQWRRGVFEYGLLASAFGLQFEQKWFARERLDEKVLEAPDFSAATDLYQVVDRVYAMHLLPVDIVSVLLLALAALLPFAPVALMAIPFDEIVSEVVGLLF